MVMFNSIVINCARSAIVSERRKMSIVSLYYWWEQFLQNLTYFSNLPEGNVTEELLSRWDHSYTENWSKVASNIFRIHHQSLILPLVADPAVCYMPYPRSFPLSTLKTTSYTGSINSFVPSCVPYFSGLKWHSKVSGDGCHLDISLFQ